VVFAAAPPFVATVFKVTKLDKLFDITESLSEALAIATKTA
jgi:hypothetical protein